MDYVLGCCLGTQAPHAKVPASKTASVLAEIMGLIMRKK